jgi:hypothetical protein
MAKSSARKASANSIQPGQSSQLNSPQPPACASSAAPTAAAPNSSRSITALMIEIAQLVAQRPTREAASARIGTPRSHKAMAMKMPKNTPRRRIASVVMRLPFPDARCPPPNAFCPLSWIGFRR